MQVASVIGLRSVVLRAKAQPKGVKRERAVEFGCQRETNINWRRRRKWREERDDLRDQGPGSRRDRLRATAVMVVVVVVPGRDGGRGRNDDGQW